MKPTILCLILALIYLSSTFAYDIYVETNAVDTVKKVFISIAERARNIKADIAPLNIKGEFTINHKELTSIHAGSTVYVKSDSSVTELFICQRANEISWLNRTATYIFQQYPESANRFVTKAFVVKTSNETCNGMVFYSEEDSLAKNAIRVFVHRLLAAYLPMNFEPIENFITSKSIIQAKVKVGDEDIYTSFKYYSVGFAFLPQNVRWEPNTLKTTTTSKKHIVFYNNREFRVTLVPFNESNVDSKSPQVSALTSLKGSGLHQKIIKSLAVEGKDQKRLAFPNRENCKIILVDPLNDQTYVDQDEIRYAGHMELKRWEVLDIEKPTETAKQLLWVIRMSVSELQEKSGRKDELLVEYPVHFRYRNPSMQLFAISQLFLRTQLFSNCDLGVKGDEQDVQANEFYVDKIKQLYGEGYKYIPLRHFNNVDELKQNKAIEFIDVNVPVGNSAVKDMVTIVTLVLSLAGAFTLFYFITKSSKAKVE